MAEHTIAAPAVSDSDAVRDDLEWAAIIIRALQRDIQRGDGDFDPTVESSLGVAGARIDRAITTLGLGNGCVGSFEDWLAPQKKQQPGAPSAVG